MLKQIIAALIVAASVAGHSHATTVYTFDRGTPYFFTFGPYNSTMHVTGSFDVAAPLANNLIFADISGLVTAYSFNDGVNTLTAPNSDIVNFFVDTNASGNITGWDIRLITSNPIPPGGTQVFIGTVTGVDLAEMHICVTQDCTQRQNTGQASGIGEGQWSFATAPSPVPLPAPFLLLALALGGLSVARWWKNRRQAQAA